jgi:hypothetical protein
MVSDERIREREARPGAHQRGRLFAVRLWKEALDGGSEYRGSVRDLGTEAYRSFRDWADLVAFMVARMEEPPRAEEVRDVGR